MFTDPNDFCGSDIEKIQSAIDAAQKLGGKVRIPARKPDQTSNRDFWLIDSAILIPSVADEMIPPAYPAPSPVG